jgi:uncharacterized protein DUF1330
VIEGTWPGSVVLIEFPSMTEAKKWHDSPEYQEIVRLRTDNTISDLILVTDSRHSPVRRLTRERSPIRNRAGSSTALLRVGGIGAARRLWLFGVKGGRRSRVLCEPERERDIQRDTVDKQAHVAETMRRIVDEPIAVVG